LPGPCPIIVGLRVDYALPLLLLEMVLIAYLGKDLITRLFEPLSSWPPAPLNDEAPSS